jgi:small subunit ribosomal protein S21
MPRCPHRWSYTSYQSDRSYKPPAAHPGTQKSSKTAYRQFLHLKTDFPPDSLTDSRFTTKVYTFRGCVCLSFEPVFKEYRVLKVKMRSGESVQQMIRRFKKLCEKEGLIRDMKRTAYYEKPSERERRRMRKAQRTIRH